MVIKDKKDWEHYRNATKLMVMNYHHMRSGNKCESCTETAVDEDEEEEGPGETTKK